MVLCYNINTTADKNWSDSTAWYNSRVPQAGDTVEIRSVNGYKILIDGSIAAISTTTIKDGGILVPSFAMSTSSFANIVIDSGGSLYASRTVSSLLRVAGTITSNGTNGLNYGTSVDAIPIAVAAFIELVCISDEQSSRSITAGANNSITFYGATRIATTTLAALAAIGSTTIVLTDDMSLRSGTLAQAFNGVADLICVGHTPTRTANGVEGDEIDFYLVSNYVSGTKTVTLGDAGAGQTVWRRGGVTPNWNTIHQTERQIGTPVYLMTYNTGIRGSAYNLRPADGINAATYIITFQNASMHWCFHGIESGVDSTISGTINGSSIGLNLTTRFNISTLISSCTYGISGGASSTLSGTINGCTYGLNNCYSVTVSGSINGCGRGLYSCYACIVTGSVTGCQSGTYFSSSIAVTGLFDGCIYGIHVCAGCFVSGSITNTDYAILYGSGHILTDAVLNNTNELYRTGNVKLYNCSFTGTEFYGYNSDYRQTYNYAESIHHDQVPNAFKVWCKGGIITKSVSLPPTGKEYSYEHACESATYPVFQQFNITLGPYERIHFTTQVYKTVTMAYLPRIWIIDCFKDPLVSGSYSVLAESIMTDVNSQWQTLDCYYYNNSTIPKQLILRTLAKNDSSIVYFYPEIKKLKSVQCDQEGVPL